MFKEESSQSEQAVESHEMPEERQEDMEVESDKQPSVKCEIK